MDVSFSLWLIDITDDIDLSTGSTMLKNLILRMIDDAFKICIDPLFPPPYPMKNYKQYRTLANYYS